MIRKLSAILLTAVLMSLCLVPASGEAIEDSYAQAMSLFSGVYGGIAFQLPGAVELYEEGDMEDGWTGSRQLIGTCAGDGAEFQLHAADISPMIAYFKTGHPDDPEDQLRLNALMNYGMFIPNRYGVEVSDIKPHGSRETGNLWADIRFTYKDTPEVPYTGRFLLAGTQAVCLVIESCEHTDSILNALRFVTAEERDALLTEKSQPVYAPLRGLEMTFPAAPIYLSGDDSVERLACFSADWTFIQVQFQPVGLALNVTGDDLKDSLLTIAKERMLPPYKTKDVLEPVMTQPAPHTARLDFAFVNQQTMGEYGQRMRGSLYAGEYGVWYIYAADTETGRAFMNSLRLEDEAAEPSAAPAVLPAEGASTLPAFRTALENLMNQSALGFSYKPGNFYWSDAVFSGGDWMRAVFSRDSQSLGAALIRLDSSASDAAIREIRMLLRSGEETDKEDWLAFSRLCSLALRGDDEIRDEHLDPEDSSLVYERIILKPLGEIPTVREDVPFPEGQPLMEIRDSGVTAALLEKRIAALTDMPLKYHSTQNGTRIYIFGNAAGMMVYTADETEDAPVTMIILVGDQPESAPLVLHGTMMAFAAMTDMSSAETAMTSYALLETPMWDELADLWPLLCRGNIEAHLLGEGDSEDWTPFGFICARPLSAE